MVTNKARNYGDLRCGKIMVCDTIMTQTSTRTLHYVIIMWTITRVRECDTILVPNKYGRTTFQLTTTQTITQNNHFLSLKHLIKYFWRILKIWHSNSSPLPFNKKKNFWGKSKSFTEKRSNFPFEASRMSINNWKRKSAYKGQWIRKWYSSSMILKSHCSQIRCSTSLCFLLPKSTSNLLVPIRISVIRQRPR